MIYVYTVKGVPSFKLITASLTFFVGGDNTEVLFSDQNTVVSSIVTMLYIRSAHLIHLVNSKFAPFYQLLPTPPTAAPDNHFFYSVSMILTPLPLFKDSTEYQEQTPCSTCNVLQVHPHCCKMEDFLLSQG